MATVSGKASSFLTFTRASTATRINASGLIESVASGKARIDYDPSTLAAKGLLVEEQRTNLLLNSETLTTQSVTVTAVPHTLSFYGTGTITLSGASTAGPLVGTGTFPTRAALTFTPTAGTLTVTVSGTVTKAQLEVGTFPTSYIPTTSASVTRSADAASIATSAFPYDSSAGTIIIEATTPNANSVNPGGGVPALVAFTDGTTNNRIQLIRAAAGNNMVYGVFSGAASQASLTTTTSWDNNTTNKIAVAWASDDFAVAFKLDAVLTDTSGLLPVGISKLNIGSREGTSYWCGWIRQITYIPRRLTDAELQARIA